MKLPTLSLNLSPKQRKIATWVGVPLSYFVCLFVFVRLTFPYDTLKERILSEFNAAEDGRTLSIDDLSGSGFFGVQAEGVTLQDGPATLNAPVEAAGDTGEAEGGDAAASDAPAVDDKGKDEAKGKPKGKAQRA